MRRRREQILLGAALAALVLGLGVGHVLARATGGEVDAGLAAAGRLDLAAGQLDLATTSTPSSAAAATSTAIPAAVAAPTDTAAPASASAPTSTADTAGGAATSTAATPAPSTTASTAPASTRAVTVATSSAPAAGLDRMEQGVLDAVNAARRLAGCQPLAVDSSLQAAARAYAQLMVERNWFDHRSPDGQSPGDRARAAGYQGGVGENLMMGFKDDPAGAVNDARYGWLHSEGHRANILNCDYRRTGVGYDPGNIQAGYADGAWVQMFG